MGRNTRWLAIGAGCLVVAGLIKSVALFASGSGMSWPQFQALLGLPALVALCWAMSSHRRQIDWRVVTWGLLLQLGLGVALLTGGLGAFFFDFIDSAVRRLLSFSEAGADFLFQSVRPHQIAVVAESGDLVNEVFIGRISPPMQNLAFWILPTIIFFSSLTTVLYHLGVMQKVVRGLAWVMQRTMKTSAAETLSAAGNIFVGQTEAPLLIKPYIKTMTRSELHAVMVGGFATVAGGVLGAYVGFLEDHIDGIAGHLVVASMMSAPAALAIAKLLLPELERDPDAPPTEVAEVPPQSADDRGAGAPAAGQYVNVVEAAAGGASEGMKLAINVAAMLIAGVALLTMFNWMVGLLPIHHVAEGAEAGIRFGRCLPEATACSPIDLQRILGVLFSPIALCMGVPWAEAGTVGWLLGEKLVATELIAYLDLAKLMAEGQLSERSAVIASYGLCGFANFASVGIQLGGIGGLAPERMKDLASLGLRAMLGGAIAACMTGAMAGFLL